MRNGGGNVVGGGEQGWGESCWVKRGEDEKETGI